MTSRDEGQSAVLYIYYDYQKQSDHEPKKLLLNLLRQLTEITGKVSSSIEEFVKQKMPRGNEPQMGEVKGQLCDEVGNYKRVFLILDGLDECNDSLGTQMLRELEALQKITVQSRICIASRQLPWIKELLTTYTCFELIAQEEDIRSYVSTTINKTNSLRKIVERNGGDELHQEIVSEVSKRAGGRWASV